MLAEDRAGNIKEKMGYETVTNGFYCKDGSI